VNLVFHLVKGRGPQRLCAGDEDGLGRESSEHLCSSGVRMHLRSRKGGPTDSMQGLEFGTTGIIQNTKKSLFTPWGRDTLASPYLIEKEKKSRKKKKRNRKTEFI